jgi:hypothetical protein
LHRSLDQKIDVLGDSDQAELIHSEASNYDIFCPEPVKLGA